MYVASPRPELFVTVNGSWATAADPDWPQVRKTIAAMTANSSGMALCCTRSACMKWFSFRGGWGVGFRTYANVCICDACQTGPATWNGRAPLLYRAVRRVPGAERRQAPARLTDSS